jgi:hypothetical protein
VVSEDIYDGPRRKELYDRGEWIGYETLPPTTNTFDKYLREHLEDVLYEYDSYTGSFTFCRANGGEIETVYATPLPDIPWHNGLPVTDLETLPPWVLAALRELGEIAGKEEKEMRKVDWASVSYFGDHDTIGRTTDGRWFWTWNIGSATDVEELLDAGETDGENGGKIFDTYATLLSELSETRPELAGAVKERFGI